MAVNTMTQDEMQVKLDGVIQKHSKEGRSALMQVLQEAQAIYGYLPLVVQREVSKGLGVSVAEIYGVVSFYSFFSLVPKGENVINICLGTACYVRGAQKILDKVEDNLGIKSGECTEDMKFSLSACRCVGACGLAPVVMINDDVYGRLTPDEVPSILAKYKED
ncbi:MAG: NAD(P)H-dependent oxidoreductase subunit E [Ruminococcaceae bacterium]|jgi:NADP-reducing hydrogenase subunit HndA|nr:NAD(P)H-dependent oxidoreductase subunit E [Oscillospiraceae bacterium]